MWRAQPESYLSHLTDAYTGTIPLVCGIEVKQPSGDSIEAVAQLGVWCAAALTKISALGGVPCEEVLPFIGWTIVGHGWHVHISWLEANGNIVSSFSFVYAVSSRFLIPSFRLS